MDCCCVPFFVLLYGFYFCLLRLIVVTFLFIFHTFSIHFLLIQQKQQQLQKKKRNQTARKPPTQNKKKNTHTHVYNFMYLSQDKLFKWLKLTYVSVCVYVTRITIKSNHRNNVNSTQYTPKPLNMNCTLCDHIQL